MRLLLEKGKQRELLKKEKESRDLSWPKLALQLNLKESKLKAFYYGEVLIDEVTFNRLKLNKDYEKFIIRKLNDNWGRSKGGKNSSGNLKDINIPERSKDLAEFWGILLGDGNIQKVKRHKVGVYSANVTGHSVLDKDYILNFVKPLGEKLFKISGRVYYSKFNNSIHLSFDSRRIVDYFEKNEFSSGDKIKNQVEIPEWIRENPKYLSACLRGLFDTDGCFYRLTNQNSFQVGFTNHNLKLLNNVRDGLMDLGINVSKIMDNRKIVITKKFEIAKFYKLVGFHNSKHLNKKKMLF
jgi:intein/homing endonuclease